MEDIRTQNTGHLSHKRVPVCPGRLTLPQRLKGAQGSRPRIPFPGTLCRVGQKCNLAGRRVISKHSGIPPVLNSQDTHKSLAVRSHTPAICSSTDPDRQLRNQKLVKTHSIPLRLFGGLQNSILKPPTWGGKERGEVGASTFC